MDLQSLSALSSTNSPFFQPFNTPQTSQNEVKELKDLVTMFSNSHDSNEKLKIELLKTSEKLNSVLIVERELKTEIAMLREELSSTKEELSSTNLELFKCREKIEGLEQTLNEQKSAMKLLVEKLETTDKLIDILNRKFLPDFPHLREVMGMRLT